MPKIMLNKFFQMLKGGTESSTIKPEKPLATEAIQAGAEQLSAAQGGSRLAESSLMRSINESMKERFAVVAGNTANHIRALDEKKFAGMLSNILPESKIGTDINKPGQYVALLRNAKLNVADHFGMIKNDIKESLQKQEINRRYDNAYATVKDWVTEDWLRENAIKHARKATTAVEAKQIFTDLRAAEVNKDYGRISEKLKPYFEEADIQKFITEFETTGKRSYTHPLYKELEKRSSFDPKDMTIDEILATPGISKKDALLDWQNAENASRALKNGTISQKMDSLSRVTANLTNTITNKLDHIVTVAKSSGMTLVEKTGMAFKNHIDNSEGIASRTKKLVNEMSDHLKTYSEEERQMMKQYRAYKNPLNIARTAYGLEHDPIAKAKVEQLFGKTLTEEHIKTDNQLTNFYDVFSDTYHDVKNAAYQWASIMPRSIKNLSNMESKDPYKASYNYHHNVATEELLTSIAEKHPNIYAKIKSLGGDTMSQSSYIWKQKNSNSLIAQDMAKNSKDFAEEILDYGNQFSGTVLNHFAKIRFNDLKDSAAIIAPMVGGGSEKKLAANALGTALTNMEKQVNDTIMKMRKPESWGEIGVGAYVDATTALLIANPNMSALGFLEIANVAAYKGAWNTAKGLVKGSKLVAEMYAGKWIKKDPFAFIEGRVDSDTLRIVDRYAAENPHLFMDVAHDADISTISGQPGLKYLFNMARFPLAAVTNIGRMTSLMAANEMAKTKMPEFYKIKETPAAIDWLVKNMHLNEFGETTKSELIDLALRGKTEEFNYRFVKASTQVEIYDPSKFNRAGYIDATKRAGGIYAMSLRFTSYPAYYINTYLSSLNRSWQAGDRAPLLRMAAIGSSIAALSVGASKSDNPITSYAGEWGAKHIPVLDPITGVLTTPYRGLGNMLTAPIAISTYPMIYGINKFYDAIGTTNKSADFLQLKALSTIKSTPWAKYYEAAANMAEKR